jgi:thiamine biosynthesis lipoprotein
MGHKMKLLVLLSILSLFLFSCSPAPSPMVAFSGNTMGTVYNVKYVNIEDANSQLDPIKMQKDIDTLLIEINQLMSTYITDSELSLLNKTQAGVAFSISPQTQYVLEEAIRLQQLSKGMLDITIGPIVNLWGFGPNARPDIVPSPERLRDTMAYVGIDKFTLSNQQVTKAHKDVYIDLSTIAKGYGVDAIAELLQSNGITNYLVDIGGEMRVAGKKQNGVDWMIAIEKPVTNERSAQKILVIGDNAIATSGDYRNYFEENGVRYSHLIDPKTGFPIHHNLVSVSVVSAKSIEADGLATALIVMGPEDGIKLAEENNIAAFFIIKEGDEFVEYQTQAFTNTVEVKQFN